MLEGMDDRSRRKIVTCSVLAIVLLVVGVYSYNWWSASVGGDVRVGLRGAKVCMAAGACIEASFRSLGGTGDHDAFFTYAELTFFAALAAAIALGWYAYRSRTGRASCLAMVGAGLCAATLGLAIATVSSVPAELAPLFERGWSFWATALGAVLGIGGAFPHLVPERAFAAMSDVGDRIHRAAVDPTGAMTGTKPDALPRAVVRPRAAPGDRDRD